MHRLSPIMTFEKSKITISIFLIVIIAFIAFLPSLKNGFINLDDPIYVTGNERITDLSLGGIKNIFTSFHHGLYKPLVLLSFAIEYHFFKLDPFIYHATNLALHLFNCVLVFWMILLISKNLAASFITAILFGIHPMHVESVAWVAERKDVLCSFFFLQAIIYYLYYRKSTRARYYAFSLIAFILSLLAKPMGITLPLVFLLFDFFQKRKLDWYVFMEKGVFFLIAIIVFIVDMLGLHMVTERGTASISVVSFDSFLVAMHGIIFYLQKLFIPLKLSCSYPYPDKINGLLPDIFLFSPAIVAFLTAVIISVSKNNRKVALGSLFFLLTVSPALQLLPSVSAIAADRYTYIPSIGIFFIVSECFSWCYSRNLKYKRALKIILVASFIAITIRLSFLTFSRAKVWKDSVILWSDALKTYPNNPIGYATLGGAYAAIGDFKQAITNFNKAIELNPELMEAYSSRASAYASIGKFEQAVADCNKVIGLNPNFAAVYYTLAVIDFLEQDYIKSWYNVNKARSLGFGIMPEFLRDLKSASGREDN